MPGNAAPDELAKIKEALRKPVVEVVFGFAFGARQTYQTAQVYLPGPTERSKWVKVGPFLTTPENTRASLLALIAHLLEDQ